MPLPRALARFNRIVTNPIQRRWAGRLPGMAIIEHKGRKSGRRFRTPVNAFRVDGGFVLPLTYGEGSDWAQNVLAAGGADVVYRRRRLSVTNPVVVRGDEAVALLPKRAAGVIGRMTARKVLRVDAPD